MVSLPNCKINLGLYITEKRTDGFHNIETCFLPVNLTDALEVIPTETNKLEFTTLGTPIVGDISKNLCVSAYQLLKEAFPDKVFPIHILLNKQIPMGAGLGGGSADGAFTLLMLNEYYNLELSQEQLIEFALMLGSDCPFFILNTPSIGKGRGEQLTALPIDLKGYSILLINPGIHISTKWAFEQITPSVRAKSISDILLQPIATWKNELVNDFEAPIAKEYPVIDAIIKDLYAKGAVYAAMTGSGSTVFGIFGQLEESMFSFPKNYVVKKVQEV